MGNRSAVHRWQLQRTRCGVVAVAAALLFEMYANIALAFSWIVEEQKENTQTHIHINISLASEKDKELV